MDLRSAFKLGKDALTSWSDDFAPSMGAALAYYTVFSLAPLVLIVIAIAGLVFGQDAARNALFGELHGMMGDQGASAVQGLVASANKPTEGVIATVIGVVVLLVGASTVFGELQSSVDRIWRAPAAVKPSGIWGMLRTRFLSFGMILGIGFLLMVSLVLSAGLAALGKWYGGVFGGWHVLATVVNFAVSFGLITVLFALIYKLMPSVKVQWHDVWIGSAVTALLFTVGKFLIGLYLGKTSAASGFGAAGSLVILLLWVYYSAQIFLMGAEFTWVYAHDYGSKRGEPRPSGATAGVPTQNSVSGGDAGTGDRALPVAPRVEPGTALGNALGTTSGVRTGMAKGQASAGKKHSADLGTGPGAAVPLRPQPATTASDLFTELRTMVRKEPVASFAVGALAGALLRAAVLKPPGKTEPR